MNFVLQSIGYLLFILYRVITFPFFILGYGLWVVYKAVQMVLAAILAIMHSINNGIENVKPALKNSLQLSRRFFHTFSNH